MANISVTNTFVNGTAADASAVNQNFTDIINGTSDGTKNFNISALTVGGLATFNGNVNFVGTVNSTVGFDSNTARDIGGPTIGLRSLYFGSGGSNTVKIVANTNASWTLTLPTSVGSAGQYLKSTGSITAWQSLNTPTISTCSGSAHSGGFSANGSGTYTTPAGVLWIKVRMVGGGGGGGGANNSGSANGSAGTNSTFGVSILTANGGGGGSGTAAANGGGAGGSGTIAGGYTGIVIVGNGGGSGYEDGVIGLGGHGGGAVLGGGAAGVATTGTVAGGGSQGYGGGGSGAANLGFAGAGGGAGGMVDCIIGSPGAAYAYVIGSAGNGGVGNLATGGAGGGGYIIVEEFYQ